MSSCDNDIFSDHAILIHQAIEIIFKLAYDNDGDAAVITDLPLGKNVQKVLEAYFSKVGIPRHNIRPLGVKDRDNTTFTLNEEFIPGTLVVFLSGSQLNGDQSDPDRDFDIITTGVNANKGFEIRLDPSKGHRLNDAPHDDESLYCSYSKRITFNTKGGS
mgnify:CR=1 FL=1|tara:strand:+ start:108647 stop:109126 length:480 start_codon:yes stop_codon:yes gene_type:complete